MPKKQVPHASDRGPKFGLINETIVLGVAQMKYLISDVWICLDA